MKIKPKLPKVSKGIRMDAGISADIKAAAELHHVDEIDIIERGAGGLARRLLKQKPIDEIDVEESAPPSESA